MENLELRENLISKLMLMRKVRLITGSFLILWGVLLWFFNIPEFNKQAFLIIALLGTFLNQPHSFIVKHVKNLNYEIFVHQVLDIVFISIGIHFLGGTDAYFAVVAYVLIIVFAGVTVTKKSSLLISFLCSAAYSFMFVLEKTKVISKSPMIDLRLNPPLDILIVVFICISFFAIGYISSFLTEIILRKNDEAKETLKKLKEAEDAMIQAEKLAVLGQFATGILHECKNPLGVVLSGIEYLEDEAKDRPDLLVFINKIKEGARRANQVVRDVLNFSRPADQQLEVVDLNTILKDNLRLLSEMFTKSNIQINKELSKFILPVKVNSSQFGQVIFNVVLNACEAMPSGGKIVVRTFGQAYQDRGIKSGFRDSSNFVVGEKIAVLEVQDEGSGIGLEELNKVFDPFFTTKGKKTNIGLGLSICKKIIDAHKGEIEIKSMPGKGTIMIIRLRQFQDELKKVEA